MRRVVVATCLGALCVLGRTARAEELRPPSGDAPAEVEAAPPLEVLQARQQIEVTLVQMRAVSLRVRDDLRLARRRGAKVQIACVDQALSRADVATRRARDTGDEALADYARGDLERARAARQRLNEIREAQRLAAKEGAACAAALPPIAQSSRTTVKLEVDPGIPAPPPR
ncbi:MAG TPA: hypothetical protein VLT33_23640 [Labilithrix sp.]|nr:hypothetical protein [Labilithrix sp.]